ncbi:MAG: rubrerythrin [delta proteobacterium ML8_F1]|nr:MAG: rubrerythrin [delta proteobacterium ML8_F1]
MKEQEIKLIKQAIVNEVEGYEFYQLAAEKAVSKEARETLLNLAKEEMTHIEYLQDLFNKVKDDRADDYNLATLEPPKTQKIFKVATLDKADLSMAMSVFSIGIQMEKASVAFYTEAKASTEIPKARELYDILIDWETLHMHQFTEEYQQLQDEWWATQSFAPF